MKFFQRLLDLAAFAAVAFATPAPLIEDAAVESVNIVIEGQPLPPFGYVHVFPTPSGTCGRPANECNRYEEA